jgi:hypothetical protein
MCYHRYIGNLLIDISRWTDGYEKKFFRFRSFSIKEGPGIRFWEDKWLGNITLREQYPALHRIIYHKGDTMHLSWNPLPECDV